MAQHRLDEPDTAGGSKELPAISAQNVSKFFGQTKALDGVDLDVRQGELISLLGPSGSGKTTLLNIFAGFLRPSRGLVTFNGEDMTLRPPHKRDIGFVFQQYALFPHMTVGDNVGYPLRVRKLAKDDIAKRVAWGLDTVQLSGLEGRRVDQLSGGQKQRVALARAIVFEPRIVLMDEPLSALDKQLREQMQIELRRLHERLGATIVYVTHDQREALTLSDRIAVLDNGQIKQLGSPRDLYEHPTSRFVAEFVGETTLVPVERAGPREVRFAGKIFTAQRDVPNTSPLYLAIRTEKLLLAPSEVNGQTNVLSGTVTQTVYQGESVRLFVELPDGSVVSLRRLCHGGEEPDLPERGHPINLRLPLENTVVVTE